MLIYTPPIAVPVSVAGIELAPCVPEEEEEVKSNGDEEAAMEEDAGDLEVWREWGGLSGIGMGLGGS